MENSIQLDQKLNTDLVFSTGLDTDNPQEIKLCENGDFYVNGNLIANDFGVYEGMRNFVQSNFEYFKNKEYGDKA